MAAQRLTPDQRVILEAALAGAELKEIVGADGWHRFFLSDRGGSYPLEIIKPLLKLFKAGPPKTGLRGYSIIHKPLPVARVILSTGTIPVSSKIKRVPNRK